MTKPWDNHREEIIRLYIKDGKKLTEVQRIMSEEHAFQASVRSYRQHFDKWHVGKYNCKKRHWGDRFPGSAPRASQWGSPFMLPPQRVPSMMRSSSYVSPGFEGVSYIPARRDQVLRPYRPVQQSGFWEGYQGQLPQTLLPPLTAVNDTRRFSTSEPSAFSTGGQHGFPHTFDSGAPVSWFHGYADSDHSEESEGVHEIGRGSPVSPC